MMLEKQIEEKVCKYAKDKGFLVYKYSSPGHAFVPDRLFISPSGRIFFVEFKAQGKNPTPGQEREHTRLRDHHIPVWVVDNVPQGKFVVDLDQ